MRFLLIGPGLIGKKHAEIIHNHDKCTLEAIVVPEITKYETLALKYNTRCYSSLEEALRERTFDAAIISSPNEFHYSQAVDCIDARIPVLVEKPLTVQIEDAKALVIYAEAKAVPVLVGHHRTYSPFLLAAKEFIDSDKFGQFVSVQGSAQFYKSANYFKAGVWRTKKGGGPILINLIHEIGILRELCGEIAKVFALASNKTRKHEVEDTVAICFEFVNGALGSFVLSDTAASNKSWEMTSGENLAYPHYPDHACYHFAGTNGSLDFPNMRYCTYDGMPEASWWQKFEDGSIHVSTADPLERQLAHFVEVVKEGKPPIVSAKSGCKNMLVIEAIRCSIEEGRSVELTEEI